MKWADSYHVIISRYLSKYACRSVYFGRLENVDRAGIGPFSVVTLEFLDKINLSAGIHFEYMHEESNQYRCGIFFISFPYSIPMHRWSETRDNNPVYTIFHSSFHFNRLSILVRMRVGYREGVYTVYSSTVDLVAPNTNSTEYN